MTLFFQLWNDATHSFIDEFDTERDAAKEVSRLYLAGGEAAINRLSIVRFYAPTGPTVIAMGNDLIAYVS